MRNKISRVINTIPHGLFLGMLYDIIFEASKRERRSIHTFHRKYIRFFHLSGFHHSFFYAFTREAKNDAKSKEKKAHKQQLPHLVTPLSISGRSVNSLGVCLCGLQLIKNDSIIVSKCLFVYNSAVD